MHETLVMIPARGGSKGIPGKNIVDVGGLPLIAYSIRAALAARNPTRVVVSTDSREIADVALEYGAEVPFMRPAELAGDDTPLSLVTNHCIETLKDQGYDAPIHCILLPPHLFRKPSLIDQGIEYHKQGWHRVYTVRRVEVRADSYLTMATDGALTPVKPRPNREMLPQRSCRGYGNLAMFAPGLPTVGSRIIELTDPIEFIDIDTEEDLAMAREVLKHDLYDFGVS